MAAPTWDCVVCIILLTLGISSATDQTKQVDDKPAGNHGGKQDSGGGVGDCGGGSGYGSCSNGQGGGIGPMVFDVLGSQIDGPIPGFGGGGGGGGGSAGGTGGGGGNTGSTGGNPSYGGGGAGPGYGRGECGGGGGGGPVYGGGGGFGFGGGGFPYSGSGWGGMGGVFVPGLGFGSFGGPLLCIPASGYGQYGYGGSGSTEDHGVHPPPPYDNFTDDRTNHDMHPRGSDMPIQEINSQASATRKMKWPSDGTNGHYHQSGKMNDAMAPKSG